MQLLQQYPNKRFVEALITIATHGARLGYEGLSSVQIRRPNHASASTHSHIITESLQSEIQKGRVKEIEDLPLNYYCSPIGLVPKPQGWRVIFDLSSPQGHSVNDSIPKEYGTIVYETLDHAIRLIAQAGKGAVMMKRDLKSAFRHIPISPCDYWLLMFEWQGKFYVDMFLPFGLRTAPRIFNLFAEALHWIFETLQEWNVTHYLDDFLFVFPPDTDIAPLSAEFDRILSTLGLSKAVEKDANGCVVVHLGFEFDSINMRVSLPLNKKRRALEAIEQLLSASSISISALESTLGFLSHCCQVVPLGRPFLRQLFSLLCQCNDNHRFHKIRVPRAAKEDLRWWRKFLGSWSAISMIQPSREIHDVATDASGVKGIGGVYRRHVFSERIAAKHHFKHIDWKEMYAVLHAFLLWHESWRGGLVRLACDNAIVVDATNKHSMKGETIKPLQTIFLIAAVFDISLLAFWIPSEENKVADAASRHEYSKLANLGLQVSHRQPSVKPSTLRRKLSTFFTTRSPLPLDGATTPLDNPMSLSATDTTIPTSQPPSARSHTGCPNSCSPPSPQRQKATSLHCVPFIANSVSPSQHLTTPVLTSSLEEANESMATASKDYDSHSRLPSFCDCSTKFDSTKKGSTSNQRSVWHLPPSYDLENLHGLHGPTNTTSPISPGNMSPSRKGM
jgi:Reverse transcriptase (RNA-dependent DNA polymerase)